MAEHGITLFLGCSNYDPAQALEQVRAMLSRGVEAVSLVGEAYPPELFELLAMHRVPYVVTYAYRDDSPHCCIGFDNRAAFAQLTTHLLDLGHRDFAIIMQPSADNDRVQARCGIHDTLAARGSRCARPSARRRGHDRIRAGEPARDRRQRRGHAADGRDLRQRRARAGRVARGAGARHRRARAIVDHRLRRHRARARDPAAADDDVGRHPRDRAPAAQALLDALENGATGPGHAVLPELRTRDSAAAPAQVQAGRKMTMRRAASTARPACHCITSTGSVLSRLSCHAWMVFGTFSSTPARSCNNASGRCSSRRTRAGRSTGHSAAHHDRRIRRRDAAHPVRIHVRVQPVEILLVGAVVDVVDERLVIGAEQLVGGRVLRRVVDDLEAQQVGRRSGLELRRGHILAVVGDAGRTAVKIRAVLRDADAPALPFEIEPAFALAVGTAVAVQHDVAIGRPYSRRCCRSARNAGAAPCR